MQWSQRSQVSCKRISRKAVASQSQVLWLNTQQMTYAYLSLCNDQLSFLQITIFYSFKLSYNILNLRSEIVYNIMETEIPLLVQTYKLAVN